MTNGAKVGIAVAVIAVGVGIWWIYYRKSGKVDLSDGTTAYKRGGKFYVDTVQIPSDEYNYLIARNAAGSTSCAQPPSSNPPIQRMAVPDPTHKNAGESCNYYGYVGVINDCSTCSLARPVQKACGDMGETADCVTGDSPLSTTVNNGWMKNEVCTPCVAKQLYS